MIILFREAPNLHFLSPLLTAPFWVKPTFSLQNYKRKQINQLGMEELCFLPSSPYSTGKAYELDSTNLAHRMGLLQNRVLLRGKSSRVEGCVARILLAMWRASGSGFLIWSIPTQAGAAVPRRASPTVQYWQPFPETRPPGSFVSPPDDLLSYLSPLINPFLFTLTRIDLSICNQKP